MAHLTSFFPNILNNEPLSHVSFELFEVEFPKTAENLCSEYQEGSIILGSMCQGGDFPCPNGTSGKSICGGKFGDENVIQKYRGPAWHLVHGKC
ncbi:hypothetical protein GH733_004039 [Mirounga leonina]|nr:hypothetical protein GH733_004039 [Mirounga leonina]